MNDAKAQDKNEAEGVASALNSGLEHIDAAMLKCWTMHADGQYDKNAFIELQRVVEENASLFRLLIVNAIAEEREACAKVCDSAKFFLNKTTPIDGIGGYFAMEIRQRSNLRDCCGDGA